ncbi:zinc ribbon domain-containing protein [Lactobacillus sp. ESL0684]|uniref:zinc ribbon domain-containing protein n=1 Tax=Lactobacillus sp. ESL0684 TaxID=2983213 RepID=UPI0023F7586E|nr:zinc ribbon domain-containing protein [Lactobacillus sp. ESL0684]WEV43513.1 zinc ribbon domain-containing protein [Lactobacillus sp. ESL0684]
MKKCPNCATIMQDDVNFCTNCGADLRNVAKMAVNRKTFQADVNQSQADFEDESDQEPIDQMQGYWQWLVKSWQHPFTRLPSTSWYGAVTLLIEDLLLVLGFYIGLNSYGSQQAFFVNIPFITVFEVLFFVILLEAAFTGVNYLVDRFIYGPKNSFLTFFNHAVQCSNLNLILIAAVFIFMMMGAGGQIFAVILSLISLNLFVLAVQVVLLGDSDPIRDKMYGIMLALFASFMVEIVWLMLAYNTVVLQFITYFSHM